MAIYWSLLGLLITYISSSEAISCLVIRPGYGLQSEACPSSAVGCRIRVMTDRIDWYEWAKLYDRNQLVCVYPEEYKTESGCQRKASGSIRCWCGSSDDCNDAENSKALYEAFIGTDGKNDNQLKHNRVKVATTTKATTTTTRSTPRRITPKKITARPTTTTTAKTTIQTTERKTKPTVTSTTQDTSSATTNTKDFPTVAAHPLPTDEDKDKYDEIFAETRRQLEEQMKEEDERLKTMLEDEEEEMRQDEADEEVTEASLTAEEEGRLDRRERARQEEKRRQEEEERLARIDREAAEEAARRTRAGTEENGEEEDYESFGLSSSACLNLPFIAIAFLLR